MKVRGIRFQLIALYSVLFGFSLIAFSLILYRDFIREQTEQFDASLFNFGLDIGDSVVVDILGNVSVSDDLSEEQRKIFPFRLGSAYVQVRREDGTSLLRSVSLDQSEIPFDGENLTTDEREHGRFADVTSEEFEPPMDSSEPLRKLSFVYKKDEWPQPLVLQIAVPIHSLLRLRERLVVFMLIALPVFLLFGIVGGIFLSRRAMNPVRELIERVTRIRAGDLSDRVPVPRTRDEISRLAETINDLLGRLDMAFQSQDRFISNASHQLRTPLTILKSELHTIQQQDEDLSQGVKDFIFSCSQEVERLIRLVNQLLLLARIEGGQADLQLNNLNFEDVVMESVVRMEKIAKLKLMTLSFQIDEPSEKDSFFEVPGDEELLSCLVDNLLENAVKYSPKGTRIEIKLAVKDKNLLMLSIVDEGPGLLNQDKERIFERFDRGTQASTRRVQGTGLGLSLARKIAELHGGRLSLENREPRGLIATVIISRNGSRPGVIVGDHL